MKLLKSLPLLVCLAAAGASAQSISIGTATSGAGTVVNLTVPLVTGGAQIAGLQFDITYDPTVLTLAVTAGSAASDASKNAQSSNLSGGTVKRVLIVGFGQDAIADGPVANVKVTIAPGAAAGTYPLAISNQSATDPNGTGLVLSATSGSIVIPATAQTITFGALNNVTFGAAPFNLTATASSGLGVSFASTTAAVCTVSGSTLTVVGAGACSITASQAGNASFAPAPDVSQSFTVAKAAQTINFGALTGQSFGGAPFTVNATASSGLAVGFASTTAAVCTVSGSTVTLVAVGACSITASQAGNANFNAAVSVAQGFTVSPASQTITFGPLSGVAFGAAPFGISATASSGLTVAFSSTTTPVCAVSGSTVTIVAGGTCSITASQAGNANYSAAASVAQSFTVSQGTQTITFAPLSGVTFGAAPFTVAASASSGLTVSFASTTTPVCTVSGSTVTIAGAGTCSITASQAGNANFSAAANVVQAFPVNIASQSITFAQPPNQAVTTPTFTLVATASSGLPVSFASTTTAVCTVSGTTATLLTAGTCTITASQTGNANYSPATSVTQSFTVSAAAQSITFGPLTSKTFGAAPFTVSATASSGLAVSFASTTAAVCTVSGSTVTIVGGGTCSITASQAGNANFGAAPVVTQSFTVSKANQTITFGGLSSKALSAAPFTVAATASSALAVGFASTTTTVCTVSGATVTLLTLGTCSIAASQPGDSNYNAATSVTQSFAVTVGSQTITFGALSNVTFGDAPFAVSATASSGLTVAFTSTTASICTVSGSTVTILGAGTCSITASQAGNASFGAAPNVSQSLTVAKASQTISFGALSDRSFSPASFAVGATASSGLAVSFASTTPSVCSVSGSSVTPIALGTCSVAASQVGNANYNPAASVPQSFAITPGSQTISFLSLSSVALGTAPFAIGATSSAGLVVTVASTTPAVCTVSGSVVTLIAAGTCTLAASQAGNATYAAATTVTQSFTVLPAPACTYSLNSSGTSVALGGGTGSFGLLTTPNCSWTAVSNVPWITITNGASGADSGTITYSAVANNTASQRVGTITAGGQTYTVTQFAAACSFALSAASADLTSAGGSITLSISASAAGCVWTSTASSASVSIDPASATAPSQVTIAVASNSGVPGRTFTPTIGGQTFTINQSGINCIVTLSAVTATVAAAGGPGSVGVTLPAGCNYSTVTGPSWISVTSGATGSGPAGGTLLYTVDANSTTAGRSGTLTIGGTALTVNQQGLACTVSLDTSALGSPFASAGGTGTVGISVNAPGCSWLASSGLPWAALSASSGTGNGSLTVTTTANAGSTARSGALNVGGQTINLSQAGTTCEYSLRSNTGEAQAAGGAGSVGVVAATGCSWTSATNDPTWLTITSSDSSGTGEVQFTAAANTNAAPRTGTLTIAGNTYSFTEEGAVCSYSLSLGSAVIGSGTAGGSVAFSTLTAGCTPTVISHSTWLTFSQTFSGKAGSVTYTADANPSGTTRTGVIEIGDQTFTVSQAGAACSYTLDANGAVFGPAGGSGNILATASGGGCTPSVTNSPPGIVTLGALAGPVSNVFTQPYTVPPFISATNAQRVVTITVGGQIFRIKQRSF